MTATVFLFHPNLGASRVNAALANAAQCALGIDDDALATRAAEYTVALTGLREALGAFDV